ncbi:MAG: hypothetical protein LBI05_03535 [Planctomycetaceae bacterium]|jgi:Ca-activated chloride channel family protein|nr:hypothetical protein [Planctomycetaceae bacterium]
MIVRVFIISLLCCLTIAAEEPRAMFNQGAELAASGQLNEATEVLRRAAVVRDKTIAAKALSLIGQIAASSAKQCLAENPAETSQENRQAILEYLQSAERSFAESLSLQPNEGVRQNIETLRAWRYTMTNIWEEYDREQRRNAELQERIRYLADWEEKLAEKVRPLSEEPNSPRKFQAGYETGKEQKRLADELMRLQEVPITDDELAEKWKRLPEIQKIAKDAAELLSNHRTEEALPKQEQVLEYLRTLLPKEENQQNQQNQNQEQNEQEQQQNQDQQSQQQESESNNGGEQESEKNEPQTSEDEQHAESPEERAERLLMQVRRKEQAAKELRDQLRALLMQTGTVEKDW